MASMGEITVRVNIKGTCATCKHIVNERDRSRCYSKRDYFHCAALLDYVDTPNGPDDAFFQPPDNFGCTKWERKE
jgi:hypothetical protein